MIMRVSLHDRASNTYYGQWLWEKPLCAGLDSPPIAHNGLVASAGFGAFGARQGDSSGNRAPARWKFGFRPKKNF
jgi:hypothetical protein